MNKKYKSKARPIDDLFKEIRKKDEKRKDAWGIFYWMYEAFWWSRWFILNLPYHLKFIKWSYQRVVRGWSDKDTWCYSYYLADIIEGGMEHLLKHQHRYPPEFVNSLQWEEVQREIIYSFKVHKMLIGSDDNCSYLLYNKEGAPEGFVMLTKEQTDKYYRGLNLFVLHFMDLGD